MSILQFGIRTDAELCQPGKQLINAVYVEGLEQSADQFNAELAQ